MKKNIILVFIIILSLARPLDAGPWACAACITASAAGCILTCAPLVVPQLVLACALECEVTAAYGPCSVICVSPTP